MPSRDADFARIVECCKDFKNIDIIPTAKLVQRALGWYDPHKPYWSADHSEMLEEALCIVWPETFGLAYRMKHLGTEVQMYPQHWETRKGQRGFDFKITSLRAERTVDYRAVGDET